jgi:purine-binding chemotaxis protein CheW
VTDAPSSLSLGVRAGARRWAIEVKHVLEIRRWTPPTVLPNQPPHVMGAIHVDGRILPVIDLARALDGPPTIAGPRSTIVVVRRQGRRAALVVDEAIDLAPGTEDATAEPLRSEERRVGKECRRLCRSRWSPYH